MKRTTIRLAAAAMVSASLLAGAPRAQTSGLTRTPGVLNAWNSERVLIDLDIDGTAYGHELLWKANTTGTNYEESIVAYVGGVAYIGSCSTHGQGHDKLFAVDCSDGSILWSYNMGPGYAGPVIDGNALYVGSCSHGNNPTNDYMYSIDRITGTPNWSRQIFTGIPVPAQFDSSSLYVCTFSQGAKVYSLNKADGAINWTYSAGLSYCANIPMLMNNAVYAAFSHPNGKLVKLDATTGNVIWSRSLPAGPWDNSITADGQGRLFMASFYGRTMDAYNEADGSRLWTYPLRRGSLSFNAYHNGVVFIADTAGYVYALDGSSGQLIWENRIGSTVDISSPTLSGGLIFIGTRDFAEGAFFALDEATGRTLWKYKIGASITAAPSIADGMMLCGADDWNTYAFDFGLGSGDWLLHRYDAENTAWSPNGLTTWQYVDAVCATQNNVTTCTVTNRYDHDLTDIRLRTAFNAYWYDSSGGLLQPDSDSYVVDSLSIAASRSLVISRYPLDWKRLLPASSPTPRHGHAMAGDTARQRVVLFGGSDGTYLDDTWEWDGTTWAPSNPATRPGVRHQHAMAYDAARQRVVLFGGYDGSAGGAGRLGDTWLWDGRDWTQQLPTSSPPDRDASAVAYDAARREIALYGGSGRSGLLDDTWLWSGSNWRQASPANHPSARSGHAMAFDGTRGEVVLFGGEDGAHRNDTWVWDGTDWRQATPATRPPIRRGHSLSYDGARERVIVFGGESGTGTLGDTWLWDGADWALGSGPGVGPSQREQHATAYDAARQQVALFGGRDSTDLGDTWVFCVAASFTAFGSGCQGSNGTPTLSACPGSCPILGRTFCAELSNVPTTGPLPVMLLGFGKQSPRVDLSVVGMTGCWSYLANPIALAFDTRTGSTARWSVTIPSSTSLIGVPFFNQGFVFDANPRPNPLGATTSNAAAAVIGSCCR